MTRFKAPFWLRFLIQKGSYLGMMLLIISAITFVVVNAAPNNFFPSGELNPNITAEDIEHLKSVYGLDQNPLHRYISWLGAIVQLDFGISFSSGQAVKDEILERLPVTLAISLISMVLIFICALYWGMRSALAHGRISDRIYKQAALVSYAFPSFYLALLLILFFSVFLGWFPIAGLESATPKEGFGRLLDWAWHLSLPIAVVVISGFGSLMIYVRSLTLEILKSDYIFFARARGLSQRVIIRRYILPNLYPPIVTILGLSLPGLIGGSVILESIFSINGMGLLFYQSALSRDYPVIMGILIIGAFLTLLGNMLADLALLKLNPYFKQGQRRD